MNKIFKRKVIFDTSFLIRAVEGICNEDACNIIDSEFPSSDWDRIIHDYVIDEFFCIEAERLKRADFYENNKIYTMSSSHEIILEEFQLGTAKSCLKKDEKIESNMLPFLRKLHWDQIKLENAHDAIKKDREASKLKFYGLIGTCLDSKVNLSLQLLKNDLNQLIEIGYEVLIPFANASMYMEGSYFDLIYYPLGNKETFRQEVSDIEQELPSLYQFLLLEQLIKRLKKPENKDKFKVLLPGLRSHVKIEFNTLADSQISLSALDYCDEFATFDKGQAQLIKFLFPEYESRIKLYQEHKNKKSYNFISLENV